MTLSPRSNPHSAKTLNKAINALIGAVYVDSDCNKRTLSVLENLNWFSANYSPNQVATPLAIQNGAVQSAVTSNLPVPAAKKSPNDGINTSLCRRIMPGQDIQSRIASLESDTGMHLQILFRDIAAPSTLDSLKSQVRFVVHAEPEYLHPPDTEWSPSERYAVIQQLSENISYLNMLRNNHILRLYQECGGDEPIHFLTAKDFHCSTKKAGNPLHRQDTETTLRMMMAIFPGTEPDRESPKFNEIKQLRRVGKRLSTLEQKFGFGILGLMHNPQNTARGTELAYLLFVSTLVSPKDHG
jgi:hypothetical protein